MAQINLDKIWANTGGVTDPGDSKYSEGWVSEIPTYQNFNFVLKAVTNNIAEYAIKGTFDWDSTIAYAKGAKVLLANKIYFCRSANTGEDPSLDEPSNGGLGNYWQPFEASAGDPDYTLPQSVGKILGNNINQPSTDWLSTELTLTDDFGSSIMLGNDSANKNAIISSFNNDLSVSFKDSLIPDGSSLNPSADPDSHRIFHEGHPPTQPEVPGTIPDAPSDGLQYARLDNGWTEVESYGPFEPGVVLPFYMDTAPIGWRNLELNDYMLRTVSVNGGSSGGTHSPILNDKVPSHTHAAETAPAGEHFHTSYSGISAAGGFYNAESTGSTGLVNTNAAGAHQHAMTILVNPNADTWRPKYLNMIICISE